MKMINFKIIIALTFIVNITSCKAQEYPLNSTYMNLPDNSYLKDINNELVQYIGTYKANFDNKEITLFITKENHKFFDLKVKKYYQDVLSIRYIVKNSSGIILQNTQNMNFQPNQLRFAIYSTKTRPTQNTIIFYYGGTNCSVGWGDIFLKKINDTQISWEYRPDDIILDSSKCPSGTDINIYLPETKDLIFTKQ
ncbi:hypothetical protein M2347_002558 [Chryseobacterium sp. H1D6B]|uniref:DUF6705 family protein n=1 Tax=Chryseobacterium sp. H1D6B TaxID=2940588 RepID=UPI0015CBEE73|nr:DUF6705 family protein [Chryseobacterium sp. H1D6B]MDH6252831.1 hypothetical protein [Chryseobacterium sp. H1D6B]